MAIQTHNPTFVPTLRGSFSLSQFAKVATEIKADPKAKPADVVSTLRSKAQTQRKLVSRINASIATREAQAKAEAKALHNLTVDNRSRCMACGKRVDDLIGASVAFKLANSEGTQGSMQASICSSHVKGDAWRG